MRYILRPAHRRAAISLAAAAVLGVSTAAVATSANAAGTHTAGPAAGPAWSRTCDAPAPGMAACNALLVNNVTEHVRAMGVTPNATPAGYGPADLRSAYKLPGFILMRNRATGVITSFDHTVPFAGPPID